MGNSASLSSLPYIVENEIESSTRPGSLGWSISKGKRKSDGAPVCVFKASKPKLIQTPLTDYFSRNSSPVTVGKDRVDPNCQLFPALHHFGKSKTLVHPYLLKVYATLDTDAPTSPASGNLHAASYETMGTTGDLIIVTEQVTTLTAWLEKPHEHKLEKIAWGLVCIVKALDFLTINAKMTHSCLCVDSIYVTPAGDFKLGNFSLLVNMGKDSGSPTSLDDKQYYQKYESYVCPSAYRSPERVNSDYDFIFNSLPTHAIDSYSLGVIIEDLYEGTVPEKLIKAVARLKTQSAMQRPRLSPLLKCPVLDIPHCKSMEFLDEIAVKPVEEKISFYQSVPDQLVRGYISQEAAKYKLLPSMMMSLKSITANPQSVTQDITRREVLAIIPPLFSICDMLDESSFQSQISPFIVTLFHLNDRGIRAALLNRLPSLTERLDKQAINSCVFEPMCTGFTDSSAALREMTLKSTLPLISRLNSVNIEKLGRYLIRLQSDSEDSIRTNTVIFISKIAPSLSENTRAKLILPAFTRAMNDPFYPCRLAALKSIMQCKEYFDSRIIASQVLPCVAPHLMDHTTEVRKEAFAVLDQFIEMLRMESNRMDESTEVGEGPTSSVEYKPAVAPTTSSSTTSTSYLSGLTSWMTSHARAPSSGGIDPVNSVENTQNSHIDSSQLTNNDLGQNDFLNFNVSTPTESRIESDGWMDDDDLLGEDNGLKEDFNGFDEFDDGNQNSHGSKAVEVDNGDRFASLSLKQADVDDFFSSSMFGTRKTGNPNILNKPLSSTSSSLSIPQKKKPSVADRKADFNQRKAVREKSKQPATAAVKKLASNPLEDSWDDF